MNDPLTMNLLDIRTKELPWEACKLAGAQAPYGYAVPMVGDTEVDEKRMALRIPFADGGRRDGVGDLLEVGGIRLDRHMMNPLVLFDHGKKIELPIAKAEDPDTGEYTVRLDPVNQKADLLAFFYRGKGLPGLSRDDEYDHALFCEQIFDLAAKKFIRSGSVGYQVIQAKQLPPDYQRGTPAGLHLLSILMLEGSLVCLPANADTVMKTDQKGYDYVKEILAMPQICGKAPSGMLVKSLAPYVPASTKVVTGYGTKSQDVQSYDAGTQIMGPNGEKVVDTDSKAIDVPVVDRFNVEKVDQAWYVTDRGLNFAGPYDSELDAKAKKDELGRVFGEKLLPMTKGGPGSGPQGDSRSPISPHERSSGEHSDKNGQTISRGSVVKMSDGRQGEITQISSNGRITIKIDGVEDSEEWPTTDSGRVELVKSLTKAIPQVPAGDSTQAEVPLTGDLSATHIPPPPMRPGDGVSIKTKGYYVVDKNGVILDGPYPTEERAYAALDTADQEDGPRVEKRDDDKNLKTKSQIPGDPAFWAEEAAEPEHRGKAMANLRKKYAKSLPNSKATYSNREKEECTCGMWRAKPPVRANEHHVSCPLHDSTGYTTESESGSGADSRDYTPYKSVSGKKVKASTRLLQDAARQALAAGYTQFQIYAGDWEELADLGSYVWNRRTSGKPSDWEWESATFANGKITATDPNGTTYTWPLRKGMETGTKSFNVKDLRKKYRSVKGLRRRTKGGRPSNATVHVAEKDLAAAKAMASELGVKCRHAGGDKGLEKLSLSGHDEGIDRVAKEFGRRRAKGFEPDRHAIAAGDAPSAFERAQRTFGPEAMSQSADKQRLLDLLSSSRSEETALTKEEIASRLGVDPRRAAFLLSCLLVEGRGLARESRSSGYVYYMAKGMETKALRAKWKNLRSNVRNAHLTSTLDELRVALQQAKDSETKRHLQEMIDECKKAGVDSFGDTPMLGGKSMPSDDVSPEKARQILKDGEANGKPLSDAQRGMFGAAAGKDKAMKTKSLVDKVRAAVLDLGFTVSSIQDRGELISVKTEDPAQLRPMFEFLDSSGFDARLKQDAVHVYSTGYTGKSLKGKHMKAKTKDLPPNSEADVDSGLPLEAGTGAEPAGDQPVKKYSAEVLERMHENASYLLAEYDKLVGPLENEAVSKFIHKELERLVEHLEDLESLHMGEHPDENPLGDGGAKDFEAPGEEAAAEEVEDDDTPEVDEADSSEPEEVPAEEAVEAGKVKALRNGKAKGWHKSADDEDDEKKDEKRLKRKAMDEDDEEKEEKRLKVRKKGVCPACKEAGKESCTCEGAKAFPDDLKDDDKDEEKSLVKAMEKDDEDEEKKGEKRLNGKKKKDLPVPGDEEFQEHPGEEVDSLVTKALEPDERGEVGEAASYAGELANERNFGEDHRMKAYYHHKNLAKLSGEKFLDPSINVGDVGVGVGSGMTKDYGDDGYAGEIPEGSTGKIRSRGTYNTYKQDQESSAPTPPSHHATSAHAHSGKPSANRNKPVATLKSLEPHPHRKMCKDASAFFGDLSRERAFGDQHREKAMRWHKDLDAIAKEDAEAEVTPTDEPAELPEPGEMGEKAAINRVKALLMANAKALEAARNEFRTIN